MSILKKNIQAMDSKIAEDICSFSCVMQESSFAHSPRSNEFFKEFIDVSHIEAIITWLWIQRVAPKTYVPSIYAPTHPNHSHELLTSTPKKLNEEHPVSDRPPPLLDKKFEHYDVAMEKKQHVSKSFSCCAEP